MHCGHIFAIRFADCQHPLTRSESTASIKNIQISAEICKSQTETKHAYNKTLIDNLQFTDYNQLQQAPIYKYGGGGARAAWRIRIRRPRLAERGARGVSDTSADFCRLQSLRRTPPYPPTLPGFSPLPTLRFKNSDFWQTFCRSKIYKKSDSSKKTHPKPQKSDPISPKP